MITRKEFLTSAGAMAAAALTGRMAHAQEYPSQDLHLICGFPAGSGADIVVRYFANHLKPLAGKNVIVENKIGANSNIATEYVARSKPDGHILYPYAASTVAATMHLYKSPPVDVGKALEVAATISTFAFMVVVHANSPYKTLPELTEGLKKKGAAASYGTTATSGVIVGALYKKAAGLEAVDVSYRDGPASLGDMASGRLDFAIQDPVFALGQARQGTLRILAVSTKERLKNAPDIPTMGEFGVPMNIGPWFAVMVAAGTPKPVIHKIHDWFSQIVSTEETRKFLAFSGGDPMTRTPEEANRMFQAEIRDWGEYVKLANIPKI